jgi:repressor LexA
MEIVAQRLLELRKSLSISQMKLAKMIGLNQSAINRYESGSGSIPDGAVFKYAEFFDVSLDWIFGRTDKPEGATFKRQPKILTDKLADERAWTEFVEMCFNPASPASAKLKEMIIAMAGGDGE